MTPRKILVALAALHLVAGIALAQSIDATAASPEEFGRVSGGQLEVLTKHGDRLSGSIGVMQSRSTDPFGNFGSSTSRGATASVGGTVVPDRVWFFAAGEQMTPISSQFNSNLPQNAQLRTIDTKVVAQLGDRNDVVGSFSATQPSRVTDFAANFAPTPSSFLSLHYSGMVSNNVLFNASVSRSTVSQIPADLLAPR